MGERETEREGEGGGRQRDLPIYKTELRPLLLPSCHHHRRRFFLFNNRTKRGENCTRSRSRFFSSITEPDAMQTVQGVAVACEEAVEILSNQGRWSEGAKSWAQSDAEGFGRGERKMGTRERGRTTLWTKAAGMTCGRRLVAKIP